MFGDQILLILAINESQLRVIVILNDNGPGKIGICKMRGDGRI